MHFRTFLESREQPFVQDIEQATHANQDFRQVLYTSKHLQLVIMTLKPGQDIGLEAHPVDQFFRIEEGSGTALVDGKKHSIEAGDVLIVPAGMKHNVVAGKDPLKLYTIYAPPHHRFDVRHATKQIADQAQESFNRKTGINPHWNS